MQLTDIDDLILFLENNHVELYEKTIFVSSSEVLKEFIIAHVAVMTANEVFRVSPLWANRCADENWPCFALSGYQFIVVNHFNKDSFWVPLKSVIKDAWDMAKVKTIRGISAKVFEKTNSHQIKLVLKETEWPR